MQALSDRTASFTDSVIRRMTRISNQYGAVNLSQGFPDFDPPKPILDRLSQVAYEDYHQYSITWGAQDFREALAKKQSHFMGRDIDPNGEIVVTCGSTEAMMAAMMTVANPGDKVVIFSPFYENYSADTILSGAVPIYVPLTPPSFTFDPEVLEDAFRQHPKALVLCNPSNPCGKVFTHEELEIIAGLAKKYDVYVITDEVYEHIIYAPHRHTYLRRCPTCGSARCPARRFPRPIPSPAGALATSSPRRRSSTARRRSTTFSPSARRRPYRRPSSPVSTSVRTTTTRCRPSTRTKRTCS